MKNTVLIVWNVVLTAIVAFLVFHVLSEDKGKKDPSPAKKSSVLSDSTSSLRIAYVNIDSLEKHYELYEQRKTELEKKQQQSEALLNKKIDAFQKDYTAAQQSATTMTESQLQSTQEKLQRQQAEIQQLQSSLQTDFQNQLEQSNKQLKDSLDSFIKTYNADKRFTYILSYSDGGDILFAEPGLDITEDAIKGLNEKLKK